MHRVAGLDSIRTRALAVDEGFKIPIDVGDNYGAVMTAWLHQPPLPTPF